MRNERERIIEKIMRRHTDHMYIDAGRCPQCALGRLREDSCGTICCTRCNYRRRKSITRHLDDPPIPRETWRHRPPRFRFKFF